MADPLLHHAPGIRTPYVWDEFIPTGRVVKDDDGLWHVGIGTDLQIAVFEMSLTRQDRKFMKELRIAS